MKLRYHAEWGRGGAAPGSRLGGARHPGGGPVGHDAVAAPAAEGRHQRYAAGAVWQRPGGCGCHWPGGHGLLRLLSTHAGSVSSQPPEGESGGPYCSLLGAYQRCTLACLVCQSVKGLWLDSHAGAHATPTQGLSCYVGSGHKLVRVLVGPWCHTASASLAILATQPQEGVPAPHAPSGGGHGPLGCESQHLGYSGHRLPVSQAGSARGPCRGA